MAKIGFEPVATTLSVQLRDDVGGVNMDVFPYFAIGGEPVLRAKMEIR